METVIIPNASLNCSRIALGTWSIGGWMWGGSDDRDARRTIHRALERGINLIDTAPIYGQGHAEELVGHVLLEYRRRDSVVVATKFGLDWSGGTVVRDASRHRILVEIEDSLRRLQTDYIDIYQVHWPDPRTPAEETAETLLQLQQDGKIRAFGVSNYSVAQMETFRQVSPLLHTAQPPYNLFERDIEKDVLPYCRHHDIAVLAYGPLCRGLLTGRMRSDTKFQGDDLRLTDPKFQPPRYAQYLDAVARLDHFAQERYGKRVIHLAVRWVLDQPGVGVALWGARRPEQLDAVSEVMGWRLDQDALAEIENILRSAVRDPVGPEFMAPPEAAA